MTTLRDPALAGLMQDRPLLISSLLEYASTYHPQREIVSRVLEGQLLHRTTYREAADRAARLARALQRLGVAVGDRVATLAWNTHRHFELFYGVAGIGAVLHTVNPRLFESQIQYILNHGGARILCVDSTFLPIVARLRDSLTSLELVVTLDRAAGVEAAGIGRTVCFEDLIAASEPISAWPTLDERAASGLCYTSGTTGDPKGVLYSHRSTVLHAFAAAQKGAMNLGCDDTIIAIAPMYHANAWGMPFVAAMVGAKLVMPGPRNDAENIVGLINAHSATFACGVPTVWTNVLEYLAGTGKHIPSLKRTTIGGSAVSEAMIAALARYGVQVLHLWGMTETSPLGVIATATPEVAALEEATRKRQLRKQGRAQYGVELKIVDTEGRDIPHDGVTAGALWVRGPWIASRYYREERPLLDGAGWFPTGDVAHIDPLGYLQITDREKDIIKSGGEWISSIELENAAAAHPDVALVAVIGVAHPKWEERPLMIVQCVEGGCVSTGSMAAFLSGRVARWWIPERVEVIDAMPLTATGKIRKTELRKRFAAQVPVAIKEPASP